MNKKTVINVLDSVQKYNVVYTGTYEEIAKLLGVKQNTLQKATMENRLVRRRYLIEKAENKQVDFRDIRREWRKVTTMLRESNKDLSKIKIVGKD